MASAFLTWHGGDEGFIRLSTCCVLPWYRTAPNQWVVELRESTCEACLAALRQLAEELAPTGTLRIDARNRSTTQAA